MTHAVQAIALVGAAALRCEKDEPWRSAQTIAQGTARTTRGAGQAWS